MEDNNLNSDKYIPEETQSPIVILYLLAAIIIFFGLIGFFIAL